MGKRFPATCCCPKICPECIDGTIPNVLPITFAGVEQGAYPEEYCLCDEEFNGQLYRLPVLHLGTSNICAWGEDFPACDPYYDPATKYISAAVVAAPGNDSRLNGLIRPAGFFDNVLFSLLVDGGELDKIDCGARYVLPFISNGVKICKWDNASFIFNPAPGDLA